MIYSKIYKGSHLVTSANLGENSNISMYYGSKLIYGNIASSNTITSKTTTTTGLSPFVITSGTSSSSSSWTQTTYLSSESKTGQYPLFYKTNTRSFSYSRTYWCCPDAYRFYDYYRKTLKFYSSLSYVHGISDYLNKATSWYRNYSVSYQDCPYAWTGTRKTGEKVYTIITSNGSTTSQYLSIETGDYYGRMGTAAFSFSLRPIYQTELNKIISKGYTTIMRPRSGFNWFGREIPEFICYYTDHATSIRDEWYHCSLTYTQSDCDLVYYDSTATTGTTSLSTANTWYTTGPYTGQVATWTASLPYKIETYNTTLTRSTTYRTTLISGYSTKKLVTTNSAGGAKRYTGGNLAGNKYFLGTASSQWYKYKNSTAYGPCTTFASFTDGSVIPYSTTSLETRHLYDDNIYQMDFITNTSYCKTTINTTNGLLKTALWVGTPKYSYAIVTSFGWNTLLHEWTCAAYDISNITQTSTTARVPGYKGYDVCICPIYKGYTATTSVHLPDVLTTYSTTATGTMQTTLSSVTDPTITFIRTVNSYTYYSSALTGSTIVRTSSTGSYLTFRSSGQNLYRTYTNTYHTSGSYSTTVSTATQTAMGTWLMSTLTSTTANTTITTTAK